MKVDYLIVGAGFAGATCARALAEGGARVLVIEQRAHVGGNAADTYTPDGVRVPLYGPHIFHTNSQRVWEFVSRFTEWRRYEHRVRAVVHDGAMLVPVPINRSTLAAFGGDEHAAREAIFRPYTVKQWGCEPEALSPAVFARVKTRDTDDDRYFSDTYQAVPRDGYAALFRALLDHPHIHVLLNTTADAFGEMEGIYDAAGVVWTGPIDQYFGYSLGRLPYRSATFRVEVQERWRLRSVVAVLNYPSPLVPYTRVTDCQMLSGQDHARTALCYETPCAEGDPYWPMPTEAAAALAARYKAKAAEEMPAVSFVGRLGTYQYLNMDQVVAQALKLSASLLGGSAS